MYLLILSLKFIIFDTFKISYKGNVKVIDAIKLCMYSHFEKCNVSCELNISVNAVQRILGDFQFN